jgi:hypothetical protein
MLLFNLRDQDFSSADGAEHITCQAVRQGPFTSKNLVPFSRCALNLADFTGE